MSSFILKRLYDEHIIVVQQLRNTEIVVDGLAKNNVCQIDT